MTTFEFGILSLPCEHARTVVSRAEVVAVAGTKEWDPRDRRVDVAIGKLRKKIRDSSKQPSIIRTVRNAGYVFLPELRQVVPKTEQ